ncbi:Rap30/74 interaction domain-containing protein [Linderina pennispora]|uniref:Transcription initiation factor IIF subunit alpha n=1 Tax=Linderina pennispora TaxID=61395 RepID=A0A1Y1W2H2_9FUNG|nr:Rap30/74 interaction domain-containing protein [Linderina pennispora]ORX67637.1 Rap30/74 interaction domain-containing protein [Linderina pennispora]
MSSGIKKKERKPIPSFLRPAGLRPGQAAPGSDLRRRRPLPPPNRAKPKSEDRPLAAAPPEDKRACTDYRLVSSAHERTHNVMRFLTSKPVDVTKFTQPVKLTRLSRTYYRRKAEKARAAAEEKRKEEEAKRAKETGMEIKEEEEQVPAAGEPVDPSKDRPKADTSIIAPFGGATRNKQMLFKKRTKQVFFADEEQRRLNIEEARPWVLEDYDEKESWNGTLEGGQKSDYVLFVLMDDGFKVVPVDRWYKFTPKLKYQTLTLDEAEEELKKAAKNETQNRWLMKKRTKQQGEEDEDEEPAEKPTKKTLVEYDNADEFDDDDDDDDGGARKKRRPTKHGDADEVDFDEEFADDEEMGDDLFGNEDDEADKQQQKNKKSELDSDVEEEDEGELGSAGKEMKKLMRKREENDAYDSDGEENPYLSVSEIDSDEEEQQPKPEEDKKDAVATDAKRAVSANAAAPAKEAAPKAAVLQKGQSDMANNTSAKKRKRPMPSAHSHSNESRKHAKTAPKPAESDDLITEKEVIELIKSGVTTTKALIGKVRSKLKANPANKARIQTIVRTVAILKDGNLSLKKRS